MAKHSHTVADGNESSSDDEKDKKQQSKPLTKFDRMMRRKNQNVLSEHYRKLVELENEEGGGDDVLSVKRVDHELPDELLVDVSSVRPVNVYEVQHY